MIDFASCLSDQLGPLGPRVKVLSQSYAQIWRDIPSHPPNPERLYPTSEKKACEREISALISRLTAEKKNFLPSRPEGEPGHLEELAASLRPFLKRIIDRLDLRIELIYDSRFIEATRRFLQAVRNFDPEIGIASVYQALRNVWIMNTLQFYLGQEVAPTDAIFGYSMIYPYLDNFLDDLKRTESEKLALVLRLKGWLEGVDKNPATPLEEKLRVLIGMIERQFSRARFPGVYQSMLAISNAQVRSLLQQRKTNPPDSSEILDISLEKGGTSVLADGYLAAGSLEPDQQDFCFGLGTFLQLADDLQDTAVDHRRGDITLFSRAAGKSPLDDLVYRLWRYVPAVVDRTLDAGRPRERALRELIPRSCALMTMESVGKHPAFFSRTCARGFQKTFPVRFSYLKKMRRTLPEMLLTGREKIRDLDSLSVAFMTLSTRAFTLD